MNNFAIAVSSLGVAIGVCLLGYHIFAVEKESPENIYARNLTHVHILFRHGARNPTKFYNNDPHKDFKWLEGKGHLTNVGMQQMYNLGKKIRKKYFSFLPEMYSHDEIRIVSSDIERTLSSAYVFLAGLYPPKGSQIWNKNIPWQPVPVHSIPRFIDNMIAIKQPCKAVDEKYDALMISDEINNKYRDLYSNLTVYTNDSIKTVLDLEMIYATWLIETENDLKLDDWIQNFFPEPIRQATCDSFNVFSYDTLMKRLRGGVILSDMLQNIKKKLSNQLPKQKMFIYSGHDLTLTALFKTLGFNECILPDYGATLVLELRAIPETIDSEIKLVYYNSSSSEPYQLKIPNCKEPCKIDQFINITKDVVPIDWEAECQNKSS